jgi:recombination protein RecT
MTTAVATTDTKFSVFLQKEGVKNMIASVLSDQKTRDSFCTSILTSVSQNWHLQRCENSSIISAGLQGCSLGLSASPSLGHFYIVPYKDKAQFQLGYKGYIQLAIRSGYYKRLNVLEIKEGELKSYDPLTEEIKVSIVEDIEEREKRETVGYYAMFEYLNGFLKNIYWTKTKMLAHAKKYSQAYRSDISKGKSESFWTTSFDDMAKKTMLRQLISKWGIMSVELQRAYDLDMTSEVGGKPVYIDNYDDTHQIADKSVEEILAEAEDQAPAEATVKQPKQAQKTKKIMVADDTISCPLENGKVISVIACESCPKSADCPEYN